MKKYLILLGLILFPLNVFAEGEVAKIGYTSYATITEAINAATDGSEITLLDDFGSSFTIPAGKNITINLNNHTLSSGLINNGVLTIKGPGNAIKDLYGTEIINNETGTLNIDGVTFNAKASLGSLFTNKGNATLNNVNFMYSDSVHENVNGKGIVFIDNNNDLIFSSGTINYGDSLFNNTGKFTINDGTFNGTPSAAGNKNTGTMIINGGNYTSSSNTLFNNNKNLTINGGSFSVKTLAKNNSSNALIDFEGGTITATDEAFSNSTQITNSKIVINGGAISSTTTDYIISDYQTGNAESGIVITGGTITSLYGKGILLNSKSSITIGKNDGTVNNDAPVINLYSGNIGGSYKDITIHYFDGHLFMKDNLDDEPFENVITPNGYGVEYDYKEEYTCNEVTLVLGPGNSAKNQTTTTTETAVVTSTIKENPKTGITNKTITFIILGGMSVIGAIFIIIFNKRKNYFY